MFAKTDYLIALIRVEVYNHVPRRVSRASFETLCDKACCAVFAVEPPLYTIKLLACFCCTFSLCLSGPTPEGKRLNLGPCRSARGRSLPLQSLQQDAVH